MFLKIVIIWLMFVIIGPASKHVDVIVHDESKSFKDIILSLDG